MNTAVLLMAIATFLMAGATICMACETRKHRKLFEEQVEEHRRELKSIIPIVKSKGANDKDAD